MADEMQVITDLLTELQMPLYEKIDSSTSSSAGNNSGGGGGGSSNKGANWMQQGSNNQNTTTTKNNNNSDSGRGRGYNPNTLQKGKGAVWKRRQPTVKC